MIICFYCHSILTLISEDYFLIQFLNTVLLICYYDCLLRFNREQPQGSHIFLFTQIVCQSSYQQLISVIFCVPLLNLVWPPQTHLRVQTQVWLSLRSPAGRSLLLRPLPQRSHRARSCPVCVWRISCCAVRWLPSTRRWLQSRIIEDTMCRF